MQQLPIPLFDGHDLYNWSHMFVTKCEGCKEINPKKKRDFSDRANSSAIFLSSMLVNKNDIQIL